MLNAPTLEKLHALKLSAMAAAWNDQHGPADVTALAFDERFGLLVEAEGRAPSAPHRALRLRRLDDRRARQPRLPHRRPRPLLLSSSTLLHELVDARLTATTVEIFHRGQRVAGHVRHGLRGRHTTDRPHAEGAARARRVVALAPDRLGPQTAALVEAILADRPHPEQGYRSCLGILRLATGYGPERLEAACARAGAAPARSHRHGDAILTHGLDRLPRAAEAPAPLTLGPAHHDHLRGPEYDQ